jgi:predicted DNA-binding protein with PD1-like motif
MNRLRSWVVGLILLTGGACATARPTARVDAPAVRWLQPSEMGPTGTAPGARHRLVASHQDGSMSYALVLARGDEVATALADFAHDEGVFAASFTAIGAVSDPEVAWFDPTRKQYQALRLAEQMEVLSLVGDIGVGQDGRPLVHAHLVLGRHDGSAFGGHLISAIASPTLEVFVTTYPHRLDKRPDPNTGLQLFDLSAPER